MNGHATRPGAWPLPCHGRPGIARRTILPRPADGLRDVRQQRDQVATDVDRTRDTHPRAEVLTSTSNSNAALFMSSGYWLER
jgi:hypothetical protein